MKLSRTGVVTGLVAGALALTACGSDATTTDNKTSSSSSESSSSAAGPACFSGSLKAEGSTAQKNAINQWIKDYQAKCSGSTINYNGTGSGAGVKQFNGKQVDFAGSDSALKADKGEVAAAKTRCGSDGLNLPMVTGPIALAYKVNGVKDLTLTSSLIADILYGKIKTWDDAKIKAANPSATLPSEPIKVFARSDESGTTENVEKYLAAVAPTVQTEKPDKVWSGAGEGKKGSDGVQQGVTSSEGAIGYMEWSFAVSGNLDVAKIDNGGGAVELTADSAAKAVSAAKVTGTGDDLALKLDYATKEGGAYPLILVTYEIVCSKYPDAATGTAVKDFLTYAAGEGQSGLKDLGYAPLPTEIQTKVQASVAKIS